MLKRLFLALALVLTVVAVVIVARAARFAPHRVRAASADPFEPLPGAVDRLAGAIRIPSVSPADSNQRDSAAFRMLHGYFARSFPRVHASMRLEVVGRDALLYTWLGTDSALPPIVLMGHIDV